MLKHSLSRTIHDSCPKCQFENPEGSLFCGSCGSPMEIKIICIQCGIENPCNFNFCNNCGSNLHQPQKTSQEINYTEPQSYTPKHLAEKILTTRSSIEGERKFVTVLFADVANYTSISEKLDPEEVHQIMDGCFKILMDEIHKYEGTINQFAGDGIMALFGAPMACEDHAQRACYAAIKIQSALEKYSQNLELRFDIQFKMRVGINSGLVVVGSIGNDLRMDYTAVGDTTNLAARMESTAEPGGILLSNNTQKLVKDFFELESIGEIEIKGKEQLQKAFQLINTGDVGTRIGASVAKGLTRFVGRKSSMSTLTEAIKKIKSGFGQIVGIVGEAGVGKSRLLIEMRNSMSQDNYDYFEGRCLQYGGSMLYLPILDIFRSIFSIKDDDKEPTIKKKINETISGIDEDFKRLTPFIQDILSLTVDDEDFLSLEPKEKREKTFEAIRDILIMLSQDSPLVIAIEDLHWIDKTSEDFLKYFIDWLANTQILLILVYRPEYTHQWGSKSFYTKIGVDQLDMNSSKELTKAILKDGEVVPELRQLILNRSAGNPLFIEEFTQTLLENGSIEKRGNQYVLKGNPDDIKVPDTIQGIIAGRLDRLEDNLKKTLQVASVIGRNFAFKILQTITGIRTELKSYLLNLQGLEFIYEKSLFPELEYIFKHALIQEVAYNSLLQKQRKEIHEKIGKAIEEIYAKRIEEFYENLAYHYSKSSHMEKAMFYLEVAGDKATRIHSLSEARRYYETALSILDKDNSDPENRQKYIDFALKWAEASQYAPLNRIRSTLRQSLEYAKIFNKQDRIAEVSYWIGKFAYMQGDIIETVPVVKQCIKWAEDLNDQELLAMSYNLYGRAGLYTGEHSIGIHYLNKGLELIKAFGKWDDVVYSMGMLGLLLGLTGEYKKSIKTLSKAIKDAQKHEIPTFEAMTFGYLGAIQFWYGNWNAAINNCRRCIDISKKLNNELPIIWGTFFNGAALFNLDKQEDGLKIMGQSIQMIESMDSVLALRFLYSLLAENLAVCGRFDEARSANEKALALSQSGQEWGKIGNYRTMGILAASEGDPDWYQVDRHMKKSIDLATRMGAMTELVQSLSCFARLLKKRGNKTDTQTYYNKAKNLAEKIGCQVQK